MRLCKLSSNALPFGMTTLEGCMKYFEDVLPWSEYQFLIVGESKKIAKDSININESCLFIYDKKIVALGKVLTLGIVDDTVEFLKLEEESYKVFSNPVNADELVTRLLENGYDKRILNSTGWNIMNEEHEQIIIQYLIEQEWKSYLKEEVSA